MNTSAAADERISLDPHPLEKYLAGMKLEINPDWFGCKRWNCPECKKTLIIAKGTSLERCDECANRRAVLASSDPPLFNEYRFYEIVCCPVAILAAFGTLAVFANPVAGIGSLVVFLLCGTVLVGISIFKVVSRIQWRLERESRKARGE